MLKQSYFFGKTLVVFESQVYLETQSKKEMHENSQIQISCFFLFKKVSICRKNMKVI